MNFEQFKKKLEHGRKLPIKITNLEEKIKEQRSKLTYKSNSSQAVSRSSSNQFENSMDKLLRLEDKLEQYQKELEHHRKCIDNILKLDILTYSEKEVIRLRYLDSERWESISDYMNWNYETKRCYQVNSSALRKIFCNDLYTFYTFYT